MHIVHLSLMNFRNYSKLELDLPSHIMVLRGDNAQGKSNLLEAIYLLATSRSHRTGTEKEIINWSAFEAELPVCRLAADVEKDDRSLRLEVALMARPPAMEEVEGFTYSGKTPIRSPQIQKRIRVNGAVRRAADLVGQLNAVMFSVLDIELIRGEPALRRRYLDITNSQIDPRYLRQLQRYQRVLWQRNRLLRQIAERQARPDELSFWDQELIQTGAYLMVQRDQTAADLTRLAETIHDELSGSRNRLRLIYCNSIDKEGKQRGCQIEEMTELYSQALHSARDKELAQGMSLIGPHRDDLRFFSSDIDIGVYGSRGQQRTVALSLKLAEARLMLSKTEEYPVLLLDDVLSELDSHRRSHLLRSVAEFQQVLMTTTDLDHFEAGFLSQAQLFTVVNGFIEPIDL